MTEKFSDYLAACRFIVYTDNNPLTHILTSAKLDATGQRWFSALAAYNFDIIYRPGRINTDADAMSRYPHEKLGEDGNHYIKVNNETVKAICSNIQAPYIKILPAASLNVIDVTELAGESMAQIELRELRKSQR